MTNKEQALQAYGDLHDRDEERNLHWKSGWMSALALAEFLPEVIPEYNNFNGEEVAKGIQDLTDYEFALARAYSVAIWVKGPNLQSLKKVFKKLQADEIDIYDDALRVWWD